MQPSRSGAGSTNRPPKGFELIQEKMNEFAQKMREAEGESTEYKRKAEILWPILRITHQRSRYIWQMTLKKIISQEVYDYCVKQRFVDTDLISHWKKPGFEYLCCLQCAQHTSQYGAACICRVPASQLTTTHPFECKTCGCRGCSGIKPGAKKPAPKAASKADLSKDLDEKPCQHQNDEGKDVKAKCEKSDDE